MLEFIRSSAQSFGVKVAFGVIILVFVFWGVGNFNDRDYSNVVAVVNGEPIVALQFETAYRNAEEALMRQHPGLTREDLEKQHLGRQVLRDLIAQTLLMQEAARAGIAVSPAELRDGAARIKAFQDDSGRFDPQAYKNVLAAQRMTPAQFEKELGRDLLRDKVYALVTGAVRVDPGEGRRRYDFLREKRDISYEFIPASSWLNKVEVSGEEARKWYEEHAQDFATPPAASVAYIRVTPAALASPGQLDEKAVAAWYEANPSRFANPDGTLRPLSEAMAEAREGLAADLGAEKLAETLDSLIEDNILGRPLAESAARFGLKAEESGMLDAAAMAASLGVQEEAAASLIGSGAGAPLDTALEAGDSYIVARVLAARPAGATSFEDARPEIEKILKSQKAQARALTAAAERLAGIEKGGKVPGDLAQATLDRGGAIAGLAPDLPLAQAIFRGSVGSWLPQPYAVSSEKAGPGALIARINGVEAPPAEEWDAISGLMEGVVRREREEEIFGLFMQGLGARARVELTNPRLVDRGQEGDD